MEHPEFPLRRARNTDRNRIIEQCAAIADARGVVSRDAATRYEGEGKPDMAATERCAAAEAEHIARTIRALLT